MKILKQVVFTVLILFAFVVLYKAYVFYGQDRPAPSAEKLSVSEILKKIDDLRVKAAQGNPADETSGKIVSPGTTDGSDESGVSDDIIAAAARVIASGAFIDKMSASDIAKILGIVSKINMSDFNALLDIFQRDEFDRASMLETLEIFSRNLSKEDIETLVEIISSNEDLMDLLK